MTEIKRVSDTGFIPWQIHTQKDVNGELNRYLCSLATTICNRSDTLNAEATARSLALWLTSISECFHKQQS